MTIFHALRMFVTEQADVSIGPITANATAAYADMRAATALPFQEQDAMIIHIIMHQPQSAEHQQDYAT